MMEANYLSQFDAVAPPDPDTIAEILAALNIRAHAYLALVVAVAAPMPAPRTHVLLMDAAQAPPPPAPTRIPLGELALVIGAAVGATWLWRRLPHAT